MLSENSNFVAEYKSKNTKNHVESCITCITCYKLVLGLNIWILVVYLYYKDTVRIILG